MLGDLDFDECEAATFSKTLSTVEEMSEGSSTPTTSSSNDVSSSTKLDSSCPALQNGVVIE